MGPGGKDTHNSIFLGELQDRTRAHFKDEFANVLYRDLHESPCPEGVRTAIIADLAERKPCMQPPFFDVVAHRQMLTRVLCRLATRRPRFGHRPILAKFVAGVLALMENETETFKVTMLFIDHLALDDYFEAGRSQNIFYEDVKKTITLIQALWPGVFEVFEKYNSMEEMNRLVSGLLRSLLMQGYQQDYQPFFCFAPLLCRLLVADAPAEDPRKFLRYAAACMLGRHYQDFEMVSDARDLRHLCGLLQAESPVDDALIRLLDCNVDVDQVTACSGWSTTPAASMGSGLVMVPWLTSLSVPVPIFGIGIALGMVVGGACGYAAGHKSGAEQIQRTLRDIVAQEECYENGDAIYEASYVDRREPKERSLSPARRSNQLEGASEDEEALFDVPEAEERLRVHSARWRPIQ